MTNKKQYCEECEDRIPTGAIILTTFGFSIVILFFSFAATGYLAVNNDERVVDVVLMGERLCESKGLEFKKFTMTEEQIPKILCVQKSSLPAPIMDGIVYVEQKQRVK